MMILKNILQIINKIPIFLMSPFQSPFELLFASNNCINNFHIILTFLTSHTLYLPNTNHYASKRSIQTGDDFRLLVDLIFTSYDGVYEKRGAGTNLNIKKAEKEVHEFFNKPNEVVYIITLLY